MKPLKRLQQMDLEAKREHYPGVPDHALPRKKFSDKTANSLTEAILTYLRLQGHACWRQSSEGRYRPGKTVTDVIGRARQLRGQWLPGTNVGHADVSAIIRGRFCAIEIKIGKDRQSEVQKKYQRQIEASGGVYFIAKDFEGFLQWFEKL